MELSPIKKLTHIEEPSDLAHYNFSDYARDNYRDGSPYTHTRGRLHTPLHYYGENEANDEAALTIFHVIQRFMFDLPEPKGEEISEEDNVFMRTLQRNSDYQQSAPRSATFKRKIDSVKQPEFHSLPPLETMSKPSSNITKVRFICSYGIHRPELRDEIYNQLCLQLTDNPSSTSRSRGWILMALCLGCFAPSDKFLNYLRNFVNKGPGGYADYCQKRLRRTLIVGNRKLPPTLIEMHAAKVEGKLILPVTVMNKKTFQLEVDSSTTCEELLLLFKEELSLKSVFGFSVFAKVFEKVFNWGCGQESVMDVISLGEQYAQHKKLPETEGNQWSIFVRKDVFLTSHKPSSDPIENNLIYAQIIGGIEAGEYVCDRDYDLAAFLSRKYYIEHGTEFDENIAGKMLEKSVPERVLDTHHTQMGLIGLMKDAFNTTPTIRASANPDVIKQEVVSLALSLWSHNFSRVYSATLVSGSQNLKGEVKIYIHGNGVNIVSVRKGKSRDLNFEHVASIKNDSPKHVKHADTSSYVSFQQYDKTTYVLKSASAVEMNKLGNVLLDDYRKGDPLYAANTMQLLY